MQSNKRAFTLIELLVVVAIIALLISILLPSLQGAKEQGKKAVCLANLRAIGTATQGYAGEDRAEQLIPIHYMMLRRTADSGLPGNPLGPRWGWRLANWMMWGGYSGTERFLAKCADDRANCGAVLGGRGSEHVYGPKTRPLNRYMFNANDDKDAKQYESYHCPSDRGYPDSPLIDDSPRFNAERPCYTTLGNSYRGSLFCYMNDAGAFAIGPWGHRASTLLNPSRLILIGEPTFFNMIGLDNGQAAPDPVVVTGWHRQIMMDNLIYADGSARSTVAEAHEPVVDNRIGDNASLTSRASTFQLDVFPTGGATIWGSGFTRPFNSLPGNKSHWPFSNAQDNLRASQ